MEMFGMFGLLRDMFELKCTSSARKYMLKIYESVITLQIHNASATNIQKVSPFLQCFYILTSYPAAGQGCCVAQI